MKAIIYSNKQWIGTADLHITDESMGVVAGKFIPNENYEAIRKTIWDFHNSNANSRFKELHNLRINCQLENGFFLSPIGGFLITDFEELPNEDLEFEAVGNYLHIIEDNFSSNPPKERIVEPWEYITIEQKIAYEEELFKEIGKTDKKGILNFLKPKKHKLHEFEFSAMAKLGYNDDVLFTVNKKGKNEFDYAVIHLTWKGKLEENDAYPSTVFFESFDHFLNYGLNPDQSDWNRSN